MPLHDNVWAMEQLLLEKSIQQDFWLDSHFIKYATVMHDCMNWETGKFDKKPSIMMVDEEGYEVEGNFFDEPHNDWKLINETT